MYCEIVIVVKRTSLTRRGLRGGELIRPRATTAGTLPSFLTSSGTTEQREYVRLPPTLELGQDNLAGPHTKSKP